MKHLLLYFLAFIVLATNTSVGELFKVPVLLNHFLEHRQRDHNIGLSQFMSMHYWGNDIKDNDTDRDMKLPFKKTVYFTHQILFCNTQINHLPNTDCLLSDQSPLFYRSKIIALSVSQLYRPPQSI